VLFCKLDIELTTEVYTFPTNFGNLEFTKLDCIYDMGY